MDKIHEEPQFLNPMNFSGKATLEWKSRLASEQGQGQGADPAHDDGRRIWHE